MFERFSDEARRVVVAAQEQARERGADEIRSEHILAALFTVPGGPAVTIMESLGVHGADIAADVGRSRPRPSDAEALATLGIDLDEVRRQVEDAFGPGALDSTRSVRGRDGKGRRLGHIPFDRTAKKVLELSLREALRCKHRHIGTEHILLGLLHSETGAAYRILTARGLRLDATRVVVEESVRGRRAG